MNKTLLLLAAILTISITAIAQSDSIIAIKAFGGYKFQQDSNYLTPKAMLKIMEDDAEAYPIMQKAKTNSGLASVIAGAGGFLIGYPLGTAVGGGEPDWRMAGIGAGLIIIAIPVAMAASKHAIQAVEIYNSNLTSSHFEQGIKLNFGLADYEIGLALKF